VETKSELLDRIAKLGIATPKTWVGSQRAVAGTAWQGKTIYYCRTQRPGEKATVIASGEDLVGRLTTAGGEGIQWAIQPLFDFDVSGASLLTTEGTYLEGVWGSPIGLLRQGLVAYRQQSDTQMRNQATSEWPQEFQLSYADGELRQMPVAADSDLVDLIHKRIDSTMAQLRDRGALGLFEWGTTAQVALILDWKPMTTEWQFDELNRVLTQVPETDQSADFERPILDLAPLPLDGQIVFDHGARLSHVVHTRFRRWGLRHSLPSLVIC